MPTVSGRVVFDIDRSVTITGVDSGLANVPVILQDINSGLRAIASTDATGNYSFTNVPNGSYRIVEAYGQGSGGSSTDFSGASIGPVPVGVNPPISFATSPPAGSTNLDSVTPDTIFVTVSGANIPNQNFLDGPVIYTPITAILDPCATLQPANLITAADNGTFGSFPAGTLADTGELTNPPYPGVTPGFIYTLPNSAVLTPADGQYTIQNLMNNTKLANENVWWRISDHTTGNETGRLMAINGSNPGAIIFQQPVNVLPNTGYLFSSWITNILKVPAAPPALGVEILDSNNNILYSQTLGNSIPFNPIVPEWKQIGTSFSSGNNTQVTVVFISQGPAAAGNDYAIDDIKLQEINFPVFTPVKSIDTSIINVGDIVTYTVTLSNTCKSPLTSVFFKDILPPQLQFVTGSATGGTNPLTDNPNPGFNLPPIAGNSTATITFKAKAISSPQINPVNNTATMDYSYTPVQGGIPNTFSKVSNPVALTIYDIADLVSKGNFVKTVDNKYANIGDILTYTILTKNTGNVPANNVIISDVIPSGTTYVPGSVTSTILFTGDPTTTIKLIPPINPGQTVTTTFKVKVGNAIPNPNPIPNQAIVSYAYTIDPAIPNGVKVTGYSTIANTQVSNATIVTKKTVDKTVSYIGDIITYNIAVTNTGNVPADNVIVTDPIPNGTVYVPGSLTVSAPSTGTPATAISLTTPIAPGATVAISFKVTVTAIPIPNPINNTATVTYSYTVDPQDPDGVTATSTSNVVLTLVFKYNFSQQITDLIESVSLEEAALAAIINSEGAKIQKMSSMPGISEHDLLCVNKSVSDMLDSISILQSILNQKLKTVDCQIDPPCM